MRTKIATTLLLLFAISASTVYFLFENTLKVDFSSNNNKKLFVVSEALALLYENEIAGKGENIRNYPGLIRYHKLIDSLVQQIHLVDSLTPDSTIYSERVDKLEGLLKQKKNYASILYQLHSSLEDSVSPARIYEDIIKLNDSIYTKVKIDTTVTEEIDSTYQITNKKKGFLGLFSKKDKELIINKQKFITTDTTILSNHDTISLKMKNKFLQLLKADSISVATVKTTERKIIRNDREISKQVTQMLEQIEEEELQQSLQKVERHEENINRTVNILTLITTISILVIFIFIYSTFKEITASNRYKKQLEQLNDNLQGLLKYRERLIYSMTHDIKAPLSSILGYISISRRLAVNPNVSDYLNSIELSANTINELVTNLLDFSRLENNTLTIQKIPFDLFDLLKELQAIFSSLAAQKNLNLKLTCSEELKEKSIEGDPFRIKQVVSNLISNAIKFTSKGDVTISAFVIENRLLIAIKDTGEGIPKDEIKDIFKSFYQLQQGKEQQLGTGLGLNICKGVAQLLDGDITVESEVDKGSIFTLSIPFVFAQQKVITKTFDLTKPILIVDDDAIQARVLQTILAKYQIKSDTILDSRTVVNHIKKEKYGVIITDIQMPNLSGLELLKNIREVDQVTPIFAMSGNPESIEQAQRAGFTHAITKPINEYQLGSILHLDLPLQEIEQTSSSKLKSTTRFSLERIKSFCESDEEIEEIIDLYLVQSKKDIESLKSGDIQLVKQTAHRMLAMTRQLEIISIIPLLEEAEKSGNIDTSFFTNWEKVEIEMASIK